jgi:hypothetical protein
MAARASRPRQTGHQEREDKRASSFKGFAVNNEWNSWGYDEWDYERDYERDLVQFYGIKGPQTSFETTEGR